MPDILRQWKEEGSLRSPGRAVEGEFARRRLRGDQAKGNGELFMSTAVCCTLAAT